MKNLVLVFCGLLFLGISMIVSSIIFSNGLSNLSSQNHIINGSLGINQSAASASKSEYLPIGEIASLFGYMNIGAFEQDLKDGKLGDIPYVNINGQLIFSRTAFEEWLVESARLRKGK